MFPLSTSGFDFLCNLSLCPYTSHRRGPTTSPRGSQDASVCRRPADHLLCFGHRAPLRVQQSLTNSNQDAEDKTGTRVPTSEKRDEDRAQTAEEQAAGFPSGPREEGRDKGDDDPNSQWALPGTLACPGQTKALVFATSRSRPVYKDPAVNAIRAREPEPSAGSVLCDNTRHIFPSKKDLQRQAGFSYSVFNSHILYKPDFPSHRRPEKNTGTAESCPAARLCPWAAV